MERSRQPYPPDSSARDGSSYSPIVIRDTASPQPMAHSAQTGVHPARSGTAKDIPKPALTARLPTVGYRVEKAARKEKPKPKPAETKLCILCVHDRKVSRARGRGFKVADPRHCEHFQNTCNVCIGKMVKAMIEDRKLDDNVVTCPHKDCECVLDYNTVRSMIFKADAEKWDNALFHHHIKSSENYLACLNSKCGASFSVEDCRGKPDKSNRGAPIECPYCKEQMCLSCSRPWHHSMSCDKAKIAEEEKSVQAIKDMGAKPCPKCGVNIEKNGGCNHMKCYKCKADFCFLCLASYVPNMKHAEGCPEGGPIMNDPRNWEDAPPGFFAAIGAPRGPEVMQAMQPPQPQPPQDRAPRAEEILQHFGIVAGPHFDEIHGHVLALLNHRRGNDGAQPPPQL